MPQQAIIKDNEFLKMITKGCYSAYRIHAAMKEQVKQPIISYSNIAERMLRLARDGLIEEVEEVEGKRSKHGAKLYRLTQEGIRTLMTNIDALNEEDIKPIMEYLSKAYGDDREFGEILVFIHLLANLDNTKLFLEAFAEHVNTTRLIPLGAALMKDLTSIEFKETRKALGMMSKLEPGLRPMIESIELITHSTSKTSKRRT